VKIKHLLKGSSPQVDALLNWIESGCMEAIKKKYLKEVVFGIYEDEEKPNVR
jgi:hypothetical protein